MRRLLLAAFFVAGLAVVLAPAVADAVAVMLPARPGPNRVALNDAIVAGRVMGMEDVDVKVAVAPGVNQQATYRIAIVSVTEVVKGKKDLKQIRVGFMPGGAIGPGPRPGFGQVQLQTGQDGLFHLAKHAVGDFYVMTTQFDFTPSQAKEQFEKEIAEAKLASNLLENPTQSLQSKEAKERYLTAALLITLYRTPKAGITKTEPISVEESKLILLALAEAEWKQPQLGGPKRPGFNYDPMAPMSVFGMLGVTQKDGFMPPAKIQSPQDYPNACRDWCRQAAGTYRIQRIVVNSTAQK
jgi:hypothetical protein